MMRSSASLPQAKLAGDRISYGLFTVRCLLFLSKDLLQTGTFS